MLIRINLEIYQKHCHTFQQIQVCCLPCFQPNSIYSYKQIFSLLSKFRFFHPVPNTECSCHTFQIIIFLISWVQVQNLLHKISLWHIRNYFRFLTSSVSIILVLPLTTESIVFSTYFYPSCRKLRILHKFAFNRVNIYDIPAPWF